MVQLAPLWLSSYCEIVSIPRRRMRGGAVWQLVGLITRRSQVQILPPLPEKLKTRPRAGFFLPSIHQIDGCFTSDRVHRGCRYR